MQFSVYNRVPHGGFLCLKNYSLTILDLLLVLPFQGGLFSPWFLVPGRLVRYSRLLNTKGDFHIIRSCIFDCYDRNNRREG